MLVLATLLLGVSIPNATAQLVWKVKHSSIATQDGSRIDSEYNFTALSSSGNVCTAGAIVSYDNRYKRIAFFRSDDGGASWAEQLDSLPVSMILTNNGIRKIQQVDPMTAFAFLDYGTFFRTTDAGRTWDQLTIPVQRIIMDFHFSDPMNGILLCAGYDSVIFTTTNGGRTWIYQSFTEPDLWSCHSYGNGKFRVFKAGFGELYTTYDNFKSLDSNVFVVECSPDTLPRRFQFHTCAYIGSDTILGLGNYYSADTPNYFYRSGLIMRSVDGGRHWEHPFVVPDTQIMTLDFATLPQHDTMFAFGVSNAGMSRNYSNYLLSPDRGETWEMHRIASTPVIFRFTAQVLL